MDYIDTINTTNHFLVTRNETRFIDIKLKINGVFEMNSRYISLMNPGVYTSLSISDFALLYKTDPYHIETNNIYKNTINQVKC